MRLKLHFQFCISLFGVILFACAPANLLAQESEKKSSSKSNGFWSRPAKRIKKPQQADDKNATQDDKKGDKEGLDSKTATEILPGPVAVNPKTSTWEFGLKITATNDCRGITATFPFPTEWPEQAIVSVEQIKTGHVGRMSVKEVGNARQILFRIKQLAAGDIAEAKVRIELKKSWLAEPVLTSELKLPAKVNSKIREYLRPSPLIESNHKRIKKLAAGIEKNPERTDWEHVESIYTWVRKTLEYRFANENFSCIQALDQGHGDCGEMTSVFVALCRAQGIPARAVWVPGHTYAEFYMESGDKKGHWIPCQLAGDYQFGAMSESRPILQKGDRFKVPGSSKPVRYIAPTLVEQSGTAGFKPEMIIRPYRPEGTAPAATEKGTAETESANTKADDK